MKDTYHLQSFPDDRRPDSAEYPTPNGFPRSARLLSAADYADVFGKNHRLSDRYWTILVHRRHNGIPRVGLAVAKKRAKRAVDRNRLKRVVRETFRLRKAGLEGMDIVVMNRDDTVRASNAELRASLVRLFEKASTK